MLVTIRSSLASIYQGLQRRMIPNWRKSWRFLSVQVSVIGIVANTLYENWPDVQQVLPAGYIDIVFLIIIAVRIIQQNSVQGGNDDNPKH